MLYIEVCSTRDASWMQQQASPLKKLLFYYSGPGQGSRPCSPAQNRSHDVWFHKLDFATVFRCVCSCSCFDKPIVHAIMRMNVYVRMYAGQPTPPLVSSRVTKPKSCHHRMPAATKYISGSPCLLGPAHYIGVYPRIPNHSRTPYGSKCISAAA